MFIRDGLLYLLVLCTYPRVIFVAMRVKLSNGLEAFRVPAMVDEPTWRLWKEHDENTQDDGWNDLKTKRYPPLRIIVRDTDIGAVGDPCCDQGANTQHELL